MLCYSPAALPKSDVAAVSGRPGRTACLGRHRERKRSYLAGFDCRRKLQHENRFVHVFGVFRRLLVSIIAAGVEIRNAARRKSHVWLYMSTFAKLWSISEMTCLAVYEHTCGIVVYFAQVFESDLGRENWPNRARQFPRRKLQFCFKLR